MSIQLISLREAAESFNAGTCQLKTTVVVRVGEAETLWELVLDTEWVSYDNHGRPMYQLFMHRADVTLGEPEWWPDALQGAGPRDVEVVMKVFGIDPDARVWAKGSMYDKE